MSLFRALTAPPFALLLAGTFISGLGENLYGIAITWWIADQVGSAQVMGQVSAFTFLPRLVFLLLGGVVGDRLSRLRALVLTGVSQGLVTALIAFLAALGQLEPWHLYAAGLIQGVTAALALPVFGSLIPSIVSREDLYSANSLLSLNVYLTSVIGPVMGALLVEQVGFSAAFALNALSFFIAAAFLAGMRSHVPDGRSGAGSKVHLWSDLLLGWQFVVGRPWLWATMLVLLLVNFTGRSTMNVALPFLVEGSLQAGIGELGLLRAAFGIGSALGAVWVGGVRTLERKGWLFYGSLFATGLLTAVLGLPFRLIVLAGAMLLMGACLAANNLVWSVVLQERVPRPILGRVVSLSNASSTALLPAGFALVGAAIGHFGAPQVFLVGGMLTALLAFVGLLLPVTRRI